MQDPFQDPKLRCDLVMKGGVTSGVVYPRAVVNLAKKYRFDNIGGTSAGAIAAVVTAAAEYGRASGGFARVAALPDELAANLLQKFQPLPALRPLFDLMLAGLTRSPGAILAALLRGYRREALTGAAPGLLVFLVLGIWLLSPGFALLGLLLALLGLLAGVALSVFRQITRDLPANDYGLCNGLTQPGADGPALTDWLAATLDSVAGLAPGDGPLTIAHLAERGITVRTVTTDLTTHRPYALPMQNNHYAFKATEFRRLFPEQVVAHMIHHSTPVSAHWQDTTGDLHYFHSDALPVVVLARMSLSFPGLIAAVPLHRIDFTLVHPDAAPGRIRCLFSDGGISSNFPVHFFDKFLPQTPTFGISLAELNPYRIRPTTPPDPRAGRIHLPTKATQGQLLPTHGFTGVLGFVMAMFDSAKDWQDSLQTILPGYRERIVTVCLKPEEGGLNLEMPPDIIALLSGLGSDAGDEIVRNFDLNEHRWRRYLVEMQAIDKMLRRFARSYDNAEPEPDALPYPQLATDYAPKSFKDLTHDQRWLIRSKAERIAVLGRTLEADPPLADFDDRLPKSHAALRNVARMDE